MATLILELAQKGLYHYHKIDKPTVRIGRAFDNDIILSDITISPHHAIIEQADNGQIILRNLSDENPLKVNSCEIENSIELEAYPVKLEIGRLHARLMPVDTQVEATRHLQCKSFFHCFIKSPVTATLLYLSILSFSVLAYLTSLLIPMKWPELLLESGTVALAIIALAMAIAGITRLAGHRWEISSTIAIVSLAFLLSEIVGITTYIASYTFNSTRISGITNSLFTLTIPPLLLWFFLTQIAHFKKLPANLITLILFISLTYNIFSTHKKTIFFTDSFSSIAHYDKTLLPWDYRLKPTVSIDTFIQQTRELKAGKFILPKE